MQHCANPDRVLYTTLYTMMLHVARMLAPQAEVVRRHLPPAWAGAQSAAWRGARPAAAGRSRPCCALHAPRPRRAARAPPASAGTWAAPRRALPSRRAQTRDPARPARARAPLAAGAARRSPPAPLPPPAGPHTERPWRPRRVVRRKGRRRLPARPQRPAPRWALRTGVAAQAAAAASRRPPTPRKPGCSQGCGRAPGLWRQTRPRRAAAAWPRTPERAPGTLSRTRSAAGCSRRSRSSRRPASRSPSSRSRAIRATPTRLWL